MSAEKQITSKRLKPPSVADSFVANEHESSERSVSSYLKNEHLLNEFSLQSSNMENRKTLQGFKWALSSLIHSRRAKYVGTDFFSDIMRRLQISRCHAICSTIKGHSEKEDSGERGR